MKKAGKRIAAWLAALALCAGMLPAVAFAEDTPAPASTASGVSASENEGAPENVPAATPGEAPAPAVVQSAPAAPRAGEVAQIGDVKYATLDEAIEAAADGATIDLLADATVTKTLNKTITIDGHGHTLTSKDDRYGFGVKGKTIHLTLKNMTAKFDYTIEVENPDYDSDLALFYINANTDFTFENVQLYMDGSGASNRLHGFYYDGGSVGTFSLKDSRVEIRNFPEDAFEWSGSSAQFVMEDSTFIADHNRSGFAGTFNATITHSNLDVINSTGNGSNGTNFVIEDQSVVNFNDNVSHGLSAGTLTIDNSTVTANGNGGNGVHTNNTLTIRNNANVTIEGNGCTLSSQWSLPGALHIGSGDSTIDKTSTVTIRNNDGSGILQKAGSLTVEDGAKLTIQNNTATKLGLGGGINNRGTVTLPASVELYNNHAETAGDDIYNETDTASITFSKTGEGWKLDGDVDKLSCSDAITGWYDDSEGTRWNAHPDAYASLHVQEQTGFANGLCTVTGKAALKAAHSIAVKVQPADITIYMGGTEGYEGTANGSGALEGSNSLPQPGFYITLPKVLDEHMKEIWKDSGDITQVTNPDGTTAYVLDLSGYMSFKEPTDDPDAGKQWKLELYSSGPSLAYSKYIYRLEPVLEEQDPVRLQFTDAADNVQVSDAFTPSAALYQEYEMTIYGGAVDVGSVVASVYLGKDGNNGIHWEDFPVQVAPGTLTIRYVTGRQGDVVTPAVTDVADALPAGGEKLEDAAVVVEDGTTFYINESQIPADNAAVSLLFDNVVTSNTVEGHPDYAATLRDEAIKTLGTSFANPQYEAKYLDLVDANNGNVWLTASKPVKVYWPYPDGTDETTQFYLVHFEGLDREMDNADVAGEIAQAVKTPVEVTADAHGISFTADGFSPFVLVWDAPVTPTPDPDPEPTPDPTPDPEPEPDPTPTPTPVTPPASTTPQTGDASHAALWAGLLALGAVGVAGTGIAMSRSKRRKAR
ncbi:MAG TPA: hypothetical protein H9883_00980 [Candidatus Ruthenibacterium merdigallinarum]|nr:hypothetical protein [Candidatus Ruthenibacterium merdigallinarum]